MLLKIDVISRRGAALGIVTSRCSGTWVPSKPTLMQRPKRHEYVLGPLFCCLQVVRYLHAKPNFGTSVVFYPSASASGAGPSQAIPRPRHSGDVKASGGSDPRLAPCRRRSCPRMVERHLAMSAWGETGCAACSAHVPSYALNHCGGGSSAGHSAGQVPALMASQITWLTSPVTINKFLKALSSINVRSFSSVSGGAHNR